MKNKHLNAIIITSMGVLLMSLESLLIKLANINAMLFSFYLGIFIFLSVNIFLLKNKKIDFYKAYTSNINIIIICSILFGVSNILFINAIKMTSVSNTVMIFASAPLFSSLFSYLIYKQKNKINIFISSFFIFIGLIIIFSNDFDTGNMKGNIYALICVILFSLSFVILSQYKEVNRYTITAGAGFVAMIVSYFFIDLFTLNINSLLIILLAGFFVSPISRVLMGQGAKTLPASEVSMLLIIETIMAPVWVFLILKEIPSNGTFLGGTIIIMTLFLNSFYILKTNK